MVFQNMLLRVVGLFCTGTNTVCVLANTMPGTGIVFREFSVSIHTFWWFPYKQLLPRQIIRPQSRLEWDPRMFTGILSLPVCWKHLVLECQCKALHFSEQSCHLPTNILQIPTTRPFRQIPFGDYGSGSSDTRDAGGDDEGSGGGEGREDEGSGQTAEEAQNTKNFTVFSSVVSVSVSCVCVCFVCVCLVCVRFVCACVCVCMYVCAFVCVCGPLFPRLCYRRGLGCGKWCCERLSLVDHGIGAKLLVQQLYE